MPATTAQPRELPLKISAKRPKCPKCQIFKCAKTDGWTAHQLKTSTGRRRLEQVPTPQRRPDQITVNAGDSIATFSISTPTTPCSTKYQTNKTVVRGAGNHYASAIYTSARNFASAQDTRISGRSRTNDSRLIRQALLRASSLSQGTLRPSTGMYAAPIDRQADRPRASSLPPGNDRATPTTSLRCTRRTRASNSGFSLRSLTQGGPAPSA